MLAFQREIRPTVEWRTVKSLEGRNARCWEGGAYPNLGNERSSIESCASSIGFGNSEASGTGCSPLNVRSGRL